MNIIATLLEKWSLTVDSLPPDTITLVACVLILCRLLGPIQNQTCISLVQVFPNPWSMDTTCDVCATRLQQIQSTDHFYWLSGTSSRSILRTVFLDQPKSSVWVVLFCCKGGRKDVRSSGLGPARYSVGYWSGNTIESFILGWIPRVLTIWFPAVSQRNRDLSSGISLPSWYRTTR